MTSLCAASALDLSIPKAKPGRRLSGFWVPCLESDCEEAWKSVFTKKAPAPKMVIKQVLFWLIKTGREWSQNKLAQWAGRSVPYVRPIRQAVEEMWRLWCGAEDVCAQQTHTSRTLGAHLNEVCTSGIPERDHACRTLCAHLVTHPLSQLRARVQNNTQENEREFSSSLEKSSTPATTSAMALPPAPEPDEDVDIVEQTTTTTMVVVEPEPIPALPAEGDDGVVEEETSPQEPVQADPCQLSLQEAFCRVGSQHTATARALYACGLRTLGDLAAMEGRGDLCGQLEMVKALDVKKTPDSWAPVIADLQRRGTARVASSAITVLRYYKLDFTGGKPLKPVPLKPWEEPASSPRKRNVGGDDLPFWLASQSRRLSEVRSEITAAGGSWPELRCWLAARVQQPDEVLHAIQSNHPALSGNPYAAEVAA